MGGRASKRKGSGFELEFAREIGGTKTPLSGALGGDFCGDVHRVVLGEKWTFECKRRASSYGTHYANLGDHRGLAYRDNNRDSLTTIRTKDLKRLFDRIDELESTATSNGTDARTLP
jgi:hypothetical protein